MTVNDGCPICASSTDVLVELGASFVTAGRRAPLPGYVCVVARTHVVEPFELDDEERHRYFEEVWRVAAAVLAQTGAVKVNYEIHGNTIPHLHTHLFPRFADDPFTGRPIDGSAELFERGPDELARLADAISGSAEPATPRVRVQLRDQPSGSGATCRRILDALPSWFGIPEAVDSYVSMADSSPAVIASVDGADVGILTTVVHNPYAAEVHLMAVLPEHHRRGIGRSMLEHAEQALVRAGVEFLQVKTLSANRSDDGYEKTRAFYLACGFRPLEEWPTLWGPSNPALQLVKAIPGRS
jgi:diadenosine tetraphosphate (Ap4A) HIT family hydrolase/GNAT superfamily N-acetyltransferase